MQQNISTINLITIIKDIHQTILLSFQISCYFYVFNLSFGKNIFQAKRHDKKEINIRIKNLN